jgi:hypothetical protein
VQAFASELRELRSAAGEPVFTKMARATGRSRTALTEAAGGDHLPTWDTVVAFVRACEGDEADWEHKWLAVREAMKPCESAATTSSLGPDTSPEPVVDDRPSPVPPFWRRRPWQLGMAAAVIVVAVAAYFRTSGSRSDSSDERPAGIIAVVQNKIAIGPRVLVEDTTPAYLSTEPQPYCKRNGCAVANTDMRSAAVVPVTCHADGAYMVNYDLRDTTVQRNPNKIASTLWYWAVLPDGRAGYISEIYLEPQFRGGLNLPKCSDNPAPSSSSGG